MVAPAWARLFPNYEWVLLLVLFFEYALFGITGDNFLTTGNAFEITRLLVAAFPSFRVSSPSETFFADTTRSSPLSAAIGISQRFSLESDTS